MPSSAALNLIVKSLLAAQTAPPLAAPNPDVRPMLLPNGNNFDQMVVPPFGLPPDRNTYMPDDVASYLGASPWQKQRGL